MNRISKSFVATFMALSSGSLVAADSYEVIELGTLGIYPTAAFSVNNNGQIVGYTSKAAVDNENNYFSRAYSYQEPQMNDLGAFEFLVEIKDSDGNVTSSTRQDFSIAFSNNDSNDAVGYSRKFVERPSDNVEIALERAVIFDNATGNLIELPDLFVDQTQSMYGIGINNSGIVVGYGNFDSPDDSAATIYKRPFYYDSNTQEITAFTPIVDELTNEAVLVDVNDSNVAVGWSNSVEDNIRLQKAVMIDPLDPTKLTKLSILDDFATLANAINADGKVVGKSFKREEGYATAFIYDINSGEAEEIGVLNDNPNSQDSEAFDINDAGIAVGTSVFTTFPTTRHAFIYENGEIKDLNDLIDCKQDGSSAIAPADWVLIEARSINNNGWITGNGIHNGEQKAFLLKPRDGVDPQVCQPFFEEDDAGDGSLPIFGFAFLAALIGIRRKY